MTRYLDYNASAPLKPAVRERMMYALSQGGNPSSVHSVGRAARNLLETAREQVAHMVNVSPSQVVFTSGGTEANNMALRTWTGPVLASAAAHDSVLACVMEPTIQVDCRGYIDLTALESRLKPSQQPALISVIGVNNETGVIQPMDDLKRLAQKHGARIHYDAVQAAGKIPLDFTRLGVDFLTLSAHKLGGPQGVGALICGAGYAGNPFIRGGGQEKRRRAGTENVAGIVGFGHAASLIHDELNLQSQLAIWRDQMEHAIITAAPDAHFVGSEVPRVANTSCILMPGVPSATQLMAFDLAGIAVSSGSACSSGKITPSHVLGAMGYDPESAGSALRVSLGWDSRPEDVMAVVQNWQMLYERTGRKVA